MANQRQLRPINELEGTLLPSSNYPVAEATLCADNVLDRARSINSANHPEVAIAVPVAEGDYRTTYDSAGRIDRDSVPASVVEPFSKKAECVPARILNEAPTYANISSPENRSLQEREESEIATGNAIMQSIQDENLLKVGEIVAGQKRREEVEVVRKANADAARRDREGIELREDRWFHHDQMNVNHQLGDQENEKNDTSPSKQRGKGYQTSDYDTSNYDGLVYKSGYEYKSIYDD